MIYNSEGVDCGEPQTLFNINTSSFCYFHTKSTQNIQEQDACSGVGMTKERVTNRRVISESYDFGELCSNHADFPQ